MVLTYALAVVAAGVNATSSVLQRKANRDLPDPGAGLSPKVLLQLVRSPAWCAGIGGVIVGFLLQAVALGVGDLSVVEPILVLELPLTLLLAAHIFHAPLRRRELAAVIGMAAGLAGVLYFLDPGSDTTAHIHWYTWLAGIAINLAAVAAALRVSHRARAHLSGRHESDRRAAAYGVAAGCQFGLTAALIKSVTDRYEQGFMTLFTGWVLYGMIVSGCFGLYLLQDALNAGRLVAAQPGLTLSDPLVSVLWGVLVFGEDVHGGVRLLFAVVCGLAMVGCVLVLVRSHALSGGESELDPGRGLHDAAADADRRDGPDSGPGGPR